MSTHKGNIGIGHTRWATHGEPNFLNAHPHHDISNKFSLIHNGIIENHNAIKIYLENNGVKFSSDTDTEVLVQFIGYLYNKEKKSFFDTVKLALKEVIGAYGILVMCKDEPDKIIAARYGSPLVIGIGENENYLASDTSAVIDFTRNILFLEDGEIVEVKKNGYVVIAESSRILVPPNYTLDYYFRLGKKMNTFLNYPWRFSFNSLRNLLLLFNFKVVSFNDYVHNDNLVVIAKKSKSILLLYVSRGFKNDLPTDDWPEK